MTVARLDRFRQLATDFWSWWRDELRASIPDALREQWARFIPHAFVHVGSDTIVIESTDGNEAFREVIDRPLSEFRPADWEVLSGVVHHYRTLLVLAHPLSWSTSIPLPKAAWSHANRMAELQLETISPLRTDQIQWNWVWQGGLDQSRMLIAMVKQSRIVSLERLFADNGVALPSIAAATGLGPVPITKGFDGSETSERRRDRRLWVCAAALILTAPLLAMAALTISVDVERARMLALDEQYGDQLRADAAAKMAQLGSRSIQPLVNRMPATQVLEVVARSLPAGARLSSLELATDSMVDLAIVSPNRNLVEQALTSSFPRVDIEPPLPGEQPQSAVHARIWVR